MRVESIGTLWAKIALFIRNWQIVCGLHRGEEMRFTVQAALTAPYATTAAACVHGTTQPAKPSVYLLSVWPSRRHHEVYEADKMDYAYLRKGQVKQLDPGSSATLSPVSNFRSQALSRKRILVKAKHSSHH